MGHALYTQMHTGSQPARMGIAASVAPYDKFPTSDGEILIGVQSDSGWRALVTHCSKPRSSPTTRASPPTSPG